MHSIPIYLNARDLLSPLRAMVERLLATPGAGPIVIVDNASTYPPLLEWYEEVERGAWRVGSGRTQIVRLGENRGELAPFVLTTHHSPLNTPYFAVSDPDLDLGEVPDDFLDVLISGLERYPERVKAGLSLRIDDLPEDGPFTTEVRRHESRFWQQRLDERWYDANVGLTFAVYRGPKRRGGFGYGPALRAAPPYTARHLPWYLTPEAIDDEWRYYFEHVCGNAAWSNKMRRLLGALRDER
jgi:hypothetical protein